MAQTCWPVFGLVATLVSTCANYLLLTLTAWLGYNDIWNLPELFTYKIFSAQWAMPIDMSEYFTMFEKLSGKWQSEHIVFATTKWADVTDAAGERRELDYPTSTGRWCLTKVHKYVDFQNTHPSAWEIIISFRKPEDNAPQIQKSIFSDVDWHSPEYMLDQLYDTSKANTAKNAEWRGGGWRGGPSWKGEDWRGGGGGGLRGDYRGKGESLGAREGGRQESNTANGWRDGNSAVARLRAQSEPMTTALSADRSERRDEQTAIDENPKSQHS